MNKPTMFSNPQPKVKPIEVFVLVNNETNEVYGSTIIAEHFHNYDSAKYILDLLNLQDFYTIESRIIGDLDE